MIAVPADSVAAIPETPPTERTPGAELDHEPPLDALLSVVVTPLHKAVGPTMGEGPTVTVTGCVTEQPVEPPTV
jgi:hypothetical protein